MEDCGVGVESDFQKEGQEVTRAQSLRQHLGVHALHTQSVHEIKLERYKGGE